ncbi:MAG: hypothetical protein GX442_26470 [Candidatus Riflebacteria bacterium]|nr:hypothetical protein [Candidatus Riflebacteria bacterium]
MNRHLTVLVIACVFTACLPAFAMPYTAGPYTVDVVVRNSTMALIPDAKVEVWPDGKTLRLRASATGYVAQTAAIQVGSSTYYKHDFTLADPKLQPQIVDLNGKPLKSAYFEAGQYGFAGNEYGFTVYVPRQLWPQPAQKRVQIVDGFWGATWKTWAKFEKIDEFYRIKVAMERKAVKWGPQFYVVIDTSKPVKPSVTQQWFDRLARLESDPQAPAGAAADLGGFLAGLIPAAEAETATRAVPRTLQAYYDQAARFADLHRDPIEN